MAVKLQHWDDPRTKAEVMKRFQSASNVRQRLEDQWQRNEMSAYGSKWAGGIVNPTAGAAVDGVVLGGVASPDQGEQTVSVAYSFKNLRLIHSQLSANPPSVAMKPSSSDSEDVRKADGADRIVQFSIRKYQMQERFDALTLNTLVYGTGVMKVVWDPTAGDPIEFDEQKGEMTMEGDIRISVPHSWNIYIDPDARVISDVKWVIEKLFIDYHEACAKWPDKKEQLQRARIQNADTYSVSSTDTNNSMIRMQHYDCVELLEYWETGLATNALQGRYCLVTVHGDVIEACKPSPFRFPKAGSIATILHSDLPDEVKEVRIARLPQVAGLPYQILSDIDVPNSVWGKSALEFAAPLQDVLTQIDTARLDNMRAHGANKMVVPESVEITDDFSNTPWDVVRVTGSQPPYFMSAPQLMPDMTAGRMDMINGINDVWGTNESMFGQQSREQSGSSMQYATNQGNMIRRRLFNKYVLVVESSYKAILNLVRKHWNTERTIRVLGKEKALEALAIKGADIDGGYDVIGEYGTNLSLDPISRRDEIMALQPLFEKAGIPPRMSMKMMKLNELQGMFDKLQLAEARQKELFDEMIATDKYLAPEPLMDHENMIAYGLEFFMTAEFKYLPEEAKALLRQHIQDRIQLAAQEGAGGVNAQPGAPGPAGAPGEMPMQPADGGGAPIAQAPVAPPILPA